MRCLSPSRGRNWTRFHRLDHEGPYIIEGAHRFEVLRPLGKESFPALVAPDEGAIEGLKAGRQCRGGAQAGRQRCSGHQARYAFTPEAVFKKYSPRIARVY